MRIQVSCILVLILLASSSLALSAAEEKTVQKMCPVLTDEPINPDIFTEYKGKRVYFCCDSCKSAFINDPEKYVANLPQFADTAAQGAQASDTSGKETEEHVGPAGRVIGEFHPLIVHFPIALILAAGLAEFLFLVTKYQLFGNAARFCIIIGALGALAAMTSGHFAEESRTFVGDYKEIVETHGDLGGITAIGAVIAALLSELARAKKSAWLMWAYRGALLICVGLVSATGYFGGMLVFGRDHFKL